MTTRHLMPAGVAALVTLSMGCLFFLPADRALLLASALSVVALCSVLFVSWPQAKVASVGFLASVLVPVVVLSAVLLAQARGHALPFGPLESPWLPVLLWLLGVALAAAFALSSGLTAGAKVGLVLASASSLFFLGALASLWIGCTHGNCL